MPDRAEAQGQKQLRLAPKLTVCTTPRATRQMTRCAKAHRDENAQEGNVIPTPEGLLEQTSPNNAVANTAKFPARHSVLVASLSHRPRYSGRIRPRIARSPMTRRRSTASLRTTCRRIIATTARVTPEHLAEETFGADVLDFGQDGLLCGLGVEALADGVVD